jgi:hypothetical protein
MPALDRPFSYSQMSSYLRCPKVWEYRYKQGLTIIRASVALRMGSLVDSGLDGALVGREEPEIMQYMTCTELAVGAIRMAYAEWAGGDGVSQALAHSQEFMDEARETLANAVSVVTRVVEDLELSTSKWQTMRDSDGVLGVQYEVRHPLRAHEHGFIGFIDWVARDERGSWEIDLKVRKAFDDDIALGFDYQLSGYQFAAGEAFGAITGVAHYQTRSKPTTPPKITKQGKLTRAKSQSCDWPTYLRMINELGLDPADFEDMQEGLPKFERWTWTRRSRTELSNTWEEIELLAERLVEAHHDPRPQPRVLDPMKCTMCDMRHVCMAELKGKDADHIRSTLYEVRKDYGPTPN